MLDMFTGAGAPLSQTGFDTAHVVLGGDTASLWSILTVETAGFGFLQDKRPKILFERHVFSKRTSRKFDASNPDISNPVQGGYSTTGVGEYARLARAMVLDRTAALESASWGLGQIMGYNAKSIGYPGVEAMVAAFKDGEDAQLAGTASFIAANPPLANAFKDGLWARVAFYYNGPKYAKNNYDTKLADNHTKYQTEEPNLDLRAAQARLTYLGFSTKGVDGELGDFTASALTAFQRAHPQHVVDGESVPWLTVTGTLNDVTAAALKAEAGI